MNSLETYSQRSRSSEHLALEWVGGRVARGTYAKGHDLPGASWWKGCQGGERRRRAGKGAGGEGKDPLAFSALQLGSSSLMGFCPDASEEVRTGRMPIYPCSVQRGVNKQIGSESLMRLLILSRPSIES